MADAEERSRRLKELKERRAQRETKTNEIVDKILADTVAKPEESKKDSPTKVEHHQEAKPQKKKQELKLQHFVGEIYIPPKEKVETYCQEIQVDLDIPDSKDEPVHKPTTSSGTSAANTHINEGQQDLPAKPQQRAVDEIKTQETSTTQEIGQDEIKNILKSKDFLDFFNRSTKLIEKALDSKNIDLFEDILLNDDATQYQDGDTKKEFQEVNTFFDQQLASNRIVTSIDWSPHLPELFLASYSQSFEGNPNDPQGVLLLWSLSLRSRPEFTCYAQSQITVAKFNQFSTSTIVGGTYSGQIVIWDLRTKSTPVQRSGMAAGGHAHPVYGLNIVGTQNSHNIVSISNDGKLCVWNTTMLNSPQREIDLRFKSQAEGNPLDPINPTCLSFTHEEANNFYTGVEDGTFFSAQVHGNQANENIMEAFSAHQAPITALSIMPNFPDVSSDVSNLLLSASYDWTVKLWNPKSRTDPLCSFESAEDYVYDVAWNPSNPALFSSVDGEGYIDLWDLSKDLEVPHLRHKGDTRALNKLAWSKDGSKLLTGSANGYLKLYGLHKNLLKPTEEAMDKFENQIYNMTKK